MPDSVNLGSVYASAELRTDNLRAGVSAAVASLNQLEQNTRGILDRMNKNSEASAARAAATAQRQAERLAQAQIEAQKRAAAITAGIMGASLLALGKQILDVTVRFDSLKRGLIAVTGSAQEADKQMVRLKEVAKLPGLGMEEAIQGSIRLQAAGLSAQMAERSLKAFGNAIATVGGGKAQLAEVTLALQQLTNRTSGFGQEIRQLQNALPQIRQMMLAAFGTADSEKLSRSGITGAQFIEKILPQFEKLKQVTGGIQNSIENLQDSSKRALTAIGETLLPAVTTATDKAADALESFAKKWKDLPELVRNSITGATGLVASLAVGGLALGKIKEGLVAIRALASSPIAITIAFSVVLSKLASDLLDPTKSALARWLRDHGMFGLSAEGGEGLLDYSGGPRKQQVQGPPVTEFERRRQRTVQAIEREISANVAFFQDPTAGGKFAQPPADVIARLRERQRKLQTDLRALTVGTPAAKQEEVPITSQGRYVAVQQQLIALQQQIAKLDEQSQKATTNAQRNLLGGQILNLKARESRLQDILDQFDPNKRQQAGEQAKKEAEDRLKIARDTADEMVRITSDEFAAERFLRRREFEQSVRDGAKRTDAARIWAKQLNDIASREFLARTGGGFMQLLPSVEDVAKESLGFQELTKVLASAGEAATGLGQAFADSLKTAAYFFTVAIHNVERVVSAAKDALDGLGTAFGNVIKDAQYLDAQMKKLGEADWAKSIEDYLMNGRVRAGEQRQQQFQQGFKKQFDFMKDLAGNIADEFYDGFANGLQKIFGKNPLGRALARTLDNALSSVMDNVLASIFRKHGNGNGMTEDSGQAGGMGGLGSLGPWGIGAALLLPTLLGKGGLGGIFKGIGRIFGFADGGIMPAGRLALVGERGPELVMPATATRVIPNGAGMTTNNYHYTIHAGGIRDPHELVRLLGYETMKTQRVRQGSG